MKDWSTHIYTAIAAAASVTCWLHVVYQWHLESYQWSLVHSASTYHCCQRSATSVPLCNTFIRTRRTTSIRLWCQPTFSPLDNIPGNQTHYTGTVWACHYATNCDDKTCECCSVEHGLETKAIHKDVGRWWSKSAPHQFQRACTAASCRLVYRPLSHNGGSPDELLLPGIDRTGRQDICHSAQRVSIGGPGRSCAQNCPHYNEGRQEDRMKQCTYWLTSYSVSE